MLVIICTKYGKNPPRTVDATERTRFSRSRPNDLENIGQGQRSLNATHPLMPYHIITNHFNLKPIAFYRNFPDRLKIAKIIPLLKKEDPHKLDDYRPISLLPAFSKIFVKAVFIQLYEYFNKNNLLYKSQYGFRTLHSTELASLEIIDIIGKDLDNEKLPIGVFLDLSKAFDTLDHTILLDKLLYYGIKGTELAWFKSYLTNRTQFVSYNGTNSRTLSITTGVPQGSILGPLLFIIYMNDIHNASSKFHAILFADDTNLTSTLCSFDVNIDNNCNSLQLSTNINKELKNKLIWLEINKCHLMLRKQNLW